MIFLTAFVLGVATSLHCVGMCGPLMLAAERLAPASGVGWWTRRLLMHAGRALTYAILGAIVGWLGYGLEWATAQQTVSLIAGGLMVTFALLAIWGRTPALPGAARLGKWVGNRLGKVLAKGQQPSGAFAVGMLNGLLPCGAVYVALAGAMGTAHPLSAAGFMAAFGLGTAPALVAVGWLGRKLGGAKLHRWSLSITLMAGLLLTVRGLGLGIPFLSPRVAEPQPTASVQGEVAPRAGFSCCRPANAPAQ